MDLQLTEQQRLIQQTVRQFTQEQIVALEGEMDPDAYELPAADYERLSAMATIPPEEVEPDVVTMNSRVRVRYESGREQQLTLAYDRDADAFGEKVSIVSPLGAALLASRAGGEIQWDSRRGWQRLRIEDIVFQPEAAGRFEL